MTKATTAETAQIDKFKAAAQELETDQSEEVFDRILKKVAKSSVKESGGKPKPPAAR